MLETTFTEIHTSLWFARWHHYSYAYIYMNAMLVKYLWEYITICLNNIFNYCFGWYQLSCFFFYFVHYSTTITHLLGCVSLHTHSHFSRAYTLAGNSDVCIYSKRVCIMPVFSSKWTSFMEVPTGLSEVLLSDARQICHHLLLTVTSFGFYDCKAAFCF